MGKQETPLSLVVTMRDVAVFWVVAASVSSVSLYLVKISGAPDSQIPVVTKQKGRGKSRVKVGDKLSHGSMVSIGKQLRLFYPAEGKREITDIKEEYLGDYTSPIVALFFKKEEALACFDSTDLQRYDTRFIHATVEVLCEIGKHHFYCCISKEVPIHWDDPLPKSPRTPLSK